MSKWPLVSAKGLGFQPEILNAKTHRLFIGISLQKTFRFWQTPDSLLHNNPLKQELIRCNLSTMMGFPIKILMQMELATSTGIVKEKTHGQNSVSDKLPKQWSIPLC